MPAKPRPDAASAAAVASFRRRAASLFYEALLVGAVLWCASVPVALVQAKFGFMLGRTLYQLYLIAAAGAYFTWHWARSGQTLAMKTWRLRVVTENGAPLTVRRALARYVAALAGLALF